MKENFLTFAVLLICLFIQIKTNFAQTPAPVDLGLLNGKAAGLVNPDYPETAKQNAVGGAVKINVIVDEKGNVIKAEAVSGELLLRDASLAAARASKFTPYLVKGKAVKMSGFLVFNFTAPPKAESKIFADDAKHFLEIYNNPDKTLTDAITKSVLKEDKHIEIQKLYDKGDYIETIRHIDLDPDYLKDNFEIRLRAAANFKLENYNDALTDIVSLINSKLFAPTAADFAFRGDIYKAQYNNAAAEADYRKALELDPGNSSVKDKISSLSGQKTGNTATVESFQRELKATLAEFDRLKPDYEKKAAAFNTLLDTEKKKTGDVDVMGLCQSLSAVKSLWVRFDPIINQTSDKISDLQKQGKVNEYFTGAAFQLGQTGEMLKWSDEKYVPEKRKFNLLFDKLGCKIIE